MKHFSKVLIALILLILYCSPNNSIPSEKLYFIGKWLMYSMGASDSTSFVWNIDANQVTGKSYVGLYPNGKEGQDVEITYFSWSVDQHLVILNTTGHSSAWFVVNKTDSTFTDSYWGDVNLRYFHKITQ
jgi:hypothetical protein